MSIKPDKRISRNVILDGGILKVLPLKQGTGQSIYFYSHCMKGSIRHNKVRKSK